MLANTLPRSGRRLRRFAATVTVAIAVLTGALIAGAPANASSYGYGSGRPGAVHAGVVAVNALEQQHTTLQVTAGPSLRVPNLTIYRSPAAIGAQHVGFVYTLTRWNGSAWVWANASQAYETRIGAGQQSVSVDPGIRLSAPTPGYYYLTVTVAWTTAAGAPLGHIPVVFNHASDYRFVRVSAGALTGSYIPYAGYVYVS